MSLPCLKNQERKCLKILTFTGHYIPGVNGGGPIRTISSLVDAMGDEFDFRIITADRDFAASEPYPEIFVNQWQPVGKARVFYASPDKLNPLFLRRLIRQTPHDILYLNSFFSPRFSILPLVLRRMRMIPRKPVILAPRGEFSIGALNLKALKKKAFICFSKALRLHQNIVWQVSSEYEKRDVLKSFSPRKAGSSMKVMIAPNLTIIRPSESLPARADKKPGELKIVFLSRISPMKNLLGALKMLKRVRGEIVFNIYGPIEDADYWEECRRVMSQLPGHVKVQYKGAVDHEDVMQVFTAHDLFFLPTKGENYGHVIIEALAAGCPVLISDQTPWRNLEQEKVGWDISLDRPEEFTSILQQCTDMEPHELASYAVCAHQFAKKRIMDPHAVRQNRELFMNVM